MTAKTLETLAAELAAAFETHKRENTDPSRKAWLWALALHHEAERRDPSYRSRY